jgi:hypothetical protein
LWRPRFPPPSLLGGIQREFSETTMQQQRYVVNPDVLSREELDGMLLVNADNGDFVLINPMGLLIWQALQRPRTTDEIVVHLMEACSDVPTEQVTADVEEFLQSLQSGGFIGEVLEEP